VKSFEYRSIVVKLSKWRVQSDQERVVDTRVANVVTEGRDEQCQSIERLQNSCDRVPRAGLWVSSNLIRREKANTEEEVEYGLENIDHMSEIVVEHKVVVGLSASHDEDREFIYER